MRFLIFSVILKKMESDLISIEEACENLGVSRPTFHNMRKSLDLTEYPFGKRVRFSWAEIQEKLQKKRSAISRIDAVSVLEIDLDEMLWVDNKIDLDRIANIDAFYTSGILCSVITRVRKNFEVELKSKLLLNASYFNQQNLFTYLNKFGEGSILIDSRIITAEKRPAPEIILPITQIGFKGAEEKVTKSIFPILKQHGFSEDIGSYITWALGELADNSHTHGETKGLCFISVERLIGQHNFLQINILDLGVGIQTTLRKNEKYASLSDTQALLTAFKPNVSSWPEEHQRGKGLTDIFQIAMRCKSFLRVESNEEAFLFDFQSVLTPMRKIKPSSHISGTRFSITLIDNIFGEKVKREDVARFIDKCMEDL